MALFRTRRNRGTRNGKNTDVHPVDEVLPPVRTLA